MPGRVAEVAAVSALAVIVTVAIAVPVLRAPSERVFGMEIVGRQHDPFTVMEQFGLPITVGMYLQPVTDITGALLARIAGAVAAYNWLVLLSFPLSAAATYALARYLALSPAGATVAAMAYAFSPFHVAHAAYHPHIAQTQWVPLYLLALWRCLDAASPLAIGFLAAASMAVTLSNFYAGLIAAVITPVAVAAYWLGTSRPSRSIRRLAITVGSLALIAVSGMAYASYAASAVVMNRAAFAFPREDLFRHSANWWSYLVPPVSHPLLGAAAHRFWTAAGVREGLLEHQLSLGWGIVALGLIALVVWRASASRPLKNAGLKEKGKMPEGKTDQIIRKSEFLPFEFCLLPSGCWLFQQPARAPARLAGVRSVKDSERTRLIGDPQPSLARVPVLVIVAAAALVCSLSPEPTIGGVTVVGPSALLYGIVPMFRSYARFGVVVQLMAALLAGIGVDYLRRTGTRRAQMVCLALVALAVGEYAVAPSALWRDVLPTTAHRWVTRQPGHVRALDCTPLDQESASVPWLTGHRVTLLGSAASDCTEPNLSQKLAATGYTHLLLRHDTAGGQSFADRPAPDGLQVAARFDDGEVFAVTAHTPAIYTSTMTGFFPREHNAGWSWRWMGADAAWTIVNTSDRPIVASLAIQMSAFPRARHMELRLDGHAVQTLVVEPARRLYQMDPLTVPPGDHELVFHPAETPTMADEVIKNGDRRALSFAFGTWSWTVREDPDTAVR